MNEENTQWEAWDLWDEASAELEDEQRLTSQLSPWMDDDERYTHQCQDLDRMARRHPAALLQGLRARENQELVGHVRHCLYCRLRTYACLGLADAAGFTGVLDFILCRAWGGRAARELADDALEALVGGDEAGSAGSDSGGQGGSDLEDALLKQFVAPFQDDLVRDAVEGVVSGETPGERLLWDLISATSRPRLRQVEPSLDPGRSLVLAFEELLMLLRTGALAGPSAGTLECVLGGVLDRTLREDRGRRDEDGGVVSLAAFRQRSERARHVAAEEVGRALSRLEETRLAAGASPAEHPVTVDGQHLVLRAVHAEHSGDGKLLLVIKEDGSELLRGKGVLLAREEIPMGYGCFHQVSGLNMARVSLTPMDLKSRPMMAFNPDDVLAHFRLEVVDDPLGVGL